MPSILHAISCARSVSVKLNVTRHVNCFTTSTKAPDWKENITNTRRCNHYRQQHEPKHTPSNIKATIPPTIIPIANPAFFAVPSVAQKNTKLFFFLNP
jgi:hypothetical protein